MLKADRYQHFHIVTSSFIKYCWVADDISMSRNVDWGKEIKTAPFSSVDSSSKCLNSVPCAVAATRER